MKHRTSEFRAVAADNMERNPPFTAEVVMIQSRLTVNEFSSNQTNAVDIQTIQGLTGSLMTLLKKMPQSHRHHTCVSMCLGAGIPKFVYVHVACVCVCYKAEKCINVMCV